MSVRRDPVAFFSTAVAADALWFPPPHQKTTGTATAATATTITVAGTPWVASQWVNKRVRITSGASIRAWSIITANGTNTLTFSDITGINGTTPTFDILEGPSPATQKIVGRFTSTASGAATLTFPFPGGVADQFNGYLVRVLTSGSGPEVGSVGRIADTTVAAGSSTVTIDDFDAITGNLTFELYHNGGPRLCIKKLSMTARSTAALSIIARCSLTTTSVAGQLEVAANTAPSIQIDYGKDGHVLAPEEGLNVVTTGLVGGAATLHLEARWVDTGTGGY